MRLDPLQQFARLHKQLTEEKSQLESRLSQIYQVLGCESSPAQIPQSSVLAEAPARPATRRGRKPKAANQMSMREALLKALSQGPLARKELVKAVEDVGYVFNTKNPLNSIGSILYGKNTPVKSRGGKFYLVGGVTPEPSGKSGGGQTVKKKKRIMSSEARARISEAQKARWAKRKRAK